MDWEPVANILTWLRDTAKEWQTLIAALIALGAARWTVGTIKHQIALQKRQMDEDRRRHEDAAYSKSLVTRARMPDALSEICAFTQRCMSFLDGRGEHLPDRPPDAINVLKEAIEFTDRQTANKISELVSLYQVHNARLYSRPVREAGPENDERMYDTTLLRRYAERLFEYGRNQVDVVSDYEPTQNEMISSLRITVELPQYLQNEQRYTGVMEIIRRRHKDVEPPA